MDWIPPPRQINLSVFSQQFSENELSISTQRKLQHSMQIYPSRRKWANISGLKSPSFQWGWAEIEPGQYTMYAFIEDGHCQLSCKHDGNKNMYTSCKSCAHTVLNFTLLHPKHSEEWKKSQILVMTAKNIALVVFGQF